MEMSKIEDVSDDKQDNEEVLAESQDAQSDHGFDNTVGATDMNHTQNSEMVNLKGNEYFSEDFKINGHLLVERSGD